MSNFIPVKIDKNNNLRFYFWGKWLTSHQVQNRINYRRKVNDKKRSTKVKSRFPSPEETGQIEIDNFGRKVRKKIFTPVKFHEGETYYFYENRWMQSNHIILKLERINKHYQKNKKRINDKKKINSCKYYKKNRESLIARGKHPLARERIRKWDNADRRKKDPTLAIFDVIKLLKKGEVTLGRVTEVIATTISRVTNQK